MAYRSGLAAQFGIGEETTVGTGVTPTVFLDLLDESMQAEYQRLESAGIRTGRSVIDSEAWNGGPIVVSGSIGLELKNRGQTKMWKHILGAPTTTGSGPYTHTYTPKDLSALGLTVQVGRPDVSGTVRPFTYAGVKVASAALACSAGEIATLGLDLVGMSETTGTSLASASLPADLKPFKFNHGSVTVAGSAVSVKAAEINIDNGLNTDRLFLGSQTYAPALQSAMRTIGGSLTVEFESLTEYGRYTAGNEFAIVLEFDNGTDSATFTMNARYDGVTQNVGGLDILEQTLPFKCIGDGSDADAFELVLVNSDSAA